MKKDTYFEGLTAYLNPMCVDPSELSKLMLQSEQVGSARQLSYVFANPV